MKKAKVALIILLFFLCFFGINFSAVTKAYAKNANNITISSYTFDCDFGGQHFIFSTDGFIKEISLSNYQQKMFIENQDRLCFSKKLIAMGFSKSDGLNYAFPELQPIIQKLTQKLNIEPEPDSVYVEKNKCKLKITAGKEGRFLNLLSFYDQILKHQNTHHFKIKLELTKVSSPNNNAKEFVEKSCFSTNFASSGDARKNNIKTALSAFDGLVLEVGEILRFNQITGLRNKDNGYSPAKIIAGGTFVEGYGGGVCQVSTTLYNACLLAGLEILEVNSHSLPVSYVEPSFDAMVNVGSSDLVVRNNSGGRLVITTSSENDICKVKIFGKKNKYKITRISEKIKILPAEKDHIETDLQKYGDYALEVGQEKRLSYPKDGYVSKGYLNFYNEKGELVKTESIRTNTYSPVKGVVLKREK